MYTKRNEAPDTAASAAYIVYRELCEDARRVFRIIII